MTEPRHDPDSKPLRLLVVMPSWVGDAVMATPALDLLRSALPGTLIGALVRPGIDQVLAGLPLIDQFHIGHAQGMMGPKRVATLIRGAQYDAALLLTNSFSTALTTRLAFIPRRIGYDRDGRGILLTTRLQAPKRDDGRWELVSAVNYYLRAARGVPGMPNAPGADDPFGVPVEGPGSRLVLATSPEEESAADEVFARGDIDPEAPIVVVNPGGNNEAKRWPPERFARLAHHLHSTHALRLLVNGSPAEADLVARIVDLAGPGAVALPPLGTTLGSLKAIIRRARLMVTCDTGPRHIAAAFGVPLVSLFGPTDYRWTALPRSVREIPLLADPDLPDDQIADDHPDRCSIDRISEESVLQAAEKLLSEPPECGAEPS